MRQLTLPIVAIAALCLLGCERADRTDADEANEPRPDRTSPGVDQSERANAASREVAEQGGRNVEASPNAPDQPGSQAAEGPQTRADYVAASRRRLGELERELQQLESRSRERGKELRKEIREEKRRLDTELERIDAQSDEAWLQMKESFADALGRLEAQIHQARKDIDPEA